MARSTVAPDTDATPTESTVDEVDESAETLTDEQVMAAINAQIAANQAASAAPRRVTIAELFQQSVALVASATGKRFRSNPQVSEQTAVKLYELTLMWALNNRSGPPSHDILPGESGGEEEEATELPIPNEILGGTPAESE